MQRYSANVSLIPFDGPPGTYWLWVTVTVWEDGKAIGSLPLFDKKIVGFPEGSNGTHNLYAFMLEAVDMSYGEISKVYAEVCRSMDEVNARPSSASTNERVWE